MARPTKYKKKFCKSIVKYFRDAPLFQEVDKEYYDKKSDTYKTISVKEPTSSPSFVRYAQSIGVNPDTLQEWKKAYPEFEVAYKIAKSYQEEWLQNASGRGFYNPAVGIMALKSNHGWTDRQDNVNTINGGLQVSIKKYDWEEDAGNRNS